MPLLADEGGKVAKAYGAHAPVVGTKRAAIIVDEDGVVRHRHDHMLGLDFQSVGRPPRGARLRFRQCVTDTLSIPAFFNGPPESGNGGYTCGRVAELVDAEVSEVSLRSPPPLDTPLEVVRDGDRVRVVQGDTLVAEGAPSELLVDMPDPVPLAEVEAAQEAGRELWTKGHPFPTCVVCGPARPDGFGIVPAALPGRNGLFGAPWTPD